MRVSENRLTIEGILNSKKMEIKKDKNGRELISGVLEVRVDETNIVPIEVFSYALTKENKENAVFKGLITVMDEYKAIEEVGFEQADKIRITAGQIKTNEFVGQDNEIHSSVRYTTNFINRVTDNTFSPKAEFRLEMIIKGLRAEIKDGEETGRGFIDGYYVDFAGNLQPCTLVAEGKAWAKMEDKIEKGQTVLFWGNIVNTVTTKTVKIEADFGEDEEKVITRSIKERLIKGAKFVEEEKKYTKEDIAKAIKVKQQYYEDLKMRKVLGETESNDEDDNFLNDL